MSVDLERQARAAIGHLERVSLYLDLGADDQIRLAIAGHPKAQAFDGTGTSSDGISDPVGNDVVARKAVDKARIDARLIARTLGRIQRDARLIANVLAPYVPASNDERNRLDPTDYCRLHWLYWSDKDARGDLDPKYCPKRFKGDMCKDCWEYSKVIGQPPDVTDVDYFFKHGNTWPPNRYDPKTRQVIGRAK